MLGKLLAVVCYVGFVVLVHLAVRALSNACERDD